MTTLFFFFFWPNHTACEILSSLTRERTHTPAVKFLWWQLLKYFFRNYVCINDSTKTRMTDFLSFQKPMEQSILVSSSYHTLHWGSQLCLGTEIPSGPWVFSQMKCYWNQKFWEPYLDPPLCWWLILAWASGLQITFMLLFCFTRLASFLLKNYLLTMELLVKYKAYILLITTVGC